jgi:hypothetical protein
MITKQETTDKPKVFKRDKGPQCVLLRLFVPEALTKASIEQMLSCGLIWYWQSAREGPSFPGQVELPATRSLTRLTAETVTDLIADLEEVVQDGQDFEYRSVDVFGSIDGLGYPLTANLDHGLQQWLREENGPIRIAIIRFRDIRDCYIYFPHHLGTELTRLWTLWRLESVTESKGEPYKKLHLAQFEHVFEAIRKSWQ